MYVHMAWPKSLVHNTEDKHQLSSPLHLQSSSRLTRTDWTGRPFLSFRSHQLIWGRSLLQILLISATTNLKAHHCPLSVAPILAYVCNTCLLSPSLGRQTGRSGVRRALQPCCHPARARVLPPLLMSCLLFRLQPFCFDIKKMFLGFADENCVLGTVSLSIWPFF